MYERFGFRGPFIFGIIFSLVDLIGRFLIIERCDSVKWGYDPLSLGSQTAESDQEKTSGQDVNAPPDAIEVDVPGQGAEANNPPKPLSFIEVMVRLVKSPRAIAAIVISLLYG